MVGDSGPEEGEEDSQQRADLADPEDEHPADDPALERAHLGTELPPCEWSWVRNFPISSPNCCPAAELDRALARRRRPAIFPAGKSPPFPGTWDVS